MSVIYKNSLDNCPLQLYLGSTRLELSWEETSGVFEDSGKKCARSGFNMGKLMQL